jgi:hypothetical protein
MTKVLEDFNIEIDENKVLKYFGYQKGFSSSEIPEWDNVLSLARKTISPAVYNVVSKINSVNSKGIVQFDNHARFKDSILLERLNEGQKGLFFLATLGLRLESEISRFLQRGLYLEGMLLDAMSWVAIQDIIKNLKKTVSKKGTLDFTLIPGLKDFPLERQRDIFRLFSHIKKEITITEYCMMVPKKSVSGIIIFH